VLYFIIVAENSNYHYTTSMNDVETAIKDFVGEQFTQWLGNYISHAIQNLPALVQISSAKPKPEKLKKFMLQIFLADQALFGAKEGDPGFLRFAIANLSEVSDPIAETALEILEERRRVEIARQNEYRAMWNRLLQGLGAESGEIENAEPKESTREYIAELSDIYSNSEWPTAAGAFFAGEQIVPIQNSIIMNLIKQNSSLSDKDVEALASKKNSNHILDKAVFDPENKSLVFEGVKRQLEVHEEFLGGLLRYLQG